MTSEIGRRLQEIADTGMREAWPVFLASRRLDAQASILRFHRDNCTRKFAAEECPECAQHRERVSDTLRMAETTEIGSVRSKGGAVGAAETPNPSFPNPSTAQPKGGKI